jgi:hypothetical protein
MRVIWGGEEKMPLPIQRVLAAKDGCPVFQASESPLKDTIDVSHKNYFNFKKELQFLTILLSRRTILVPP